MEALKHLKLPLLDFQLVRILDNKLIIAYNGIDRSSKRNQTIKFVEELPESWVRMNEEEKLSWTRFIIIKAMTHELDEYLFISGMGKDPHT